jgi:hypothetical protein
MTENSDLKPAPKSLPKFDELPNFHEYSGCAWGVWGEGDQLGTVNLLTEDVVAEAAKEVRWVFFAITGLMFPSSFKLCPSDSFLLIYRLGKMISLNL